MSDNPTDVDPGVEGGDGNDDTSQDTGDSAETETVPKQQFEKLQKEFSRTAKLARDLKKQLNAFKAKPQEQDDDDDADDEDDDGDEPKKPDAKGDAAKWQQRVKREREKAQREIEKARSEAQAAIERANRQIATDTLRKTALDRGAAPKLVEQFIKLFRDEFEFDFDGDDPVVTVRDSKHFDYADYMAELLDENPHFKASKRKAGTGDDGGADDAGNGAGPRLPNGFDSWPLEKKKAHFAKMSKEDRRKLASQFG